MTCPIRSAISCSPPCWPIGLGLAAIALLLVFRPVVDRRLHRRPAPQHRRDNRRPPFRTAEAPGGAAAVRRTSTEAETAEDFERAPRHRHPARGGTLDYFALRSDKQHFFDRDSVVAYAIRSGRLPRLARTRSGRRRSGSGCGPGFRRFADEHGWTIAVLAAGQDWLPIYRQSGMRDLYIGDEGVVDVRTLSLQGGTKKGLRQAVNRIAKYGYTLSFHDPADCRRRPCRGAPLGHDTEPPGRGRAGLLHDARPHLRSPRRRTPARSRLRSRRPPVAFCQFVPAPGIDGYSLDLMRRDNGDHPNGSVRLHPRADDGALCARPATPASASTSP